MQELASFILAAALHVAALLATVTPQTNAGSAAARVEVQVVEVPRLPPAPPPAPEPSDSAAKRQAIEKPVAPIGRGKAGAIKPASAPSPIGDIPAVRNGAADALLLRLGSPGDGAADAISDDRATDAPPPAEKPAILPAPLEDYAHAQVKYPPEAVDALASGRVLLRLSVDERGNVSDVAVLERAGHGFDELAAELARGYKFRPARSRDGKAQAAEIGWRMAFSEWRPAPGGLQSAPASVAGGVVPLEPSPSPARPAPPPPPPPPKPMSREEVEARPIASLSEVERHELCRWQIRIRGGVHPEKCFGGASRDDRLNDMIGGPADPARGAWHASLGTQEPDAFTPRHRVSLKTEIMVFVKPEAECVKETRGLDECRVTVGQYVECMTTLAEHPCDWRRIPACYRMGKECQ